MNIDISGRLYKVDNRVYFGCTELNVHNQRGRLFVKHKGRQINLHNIPVLPAQGVNDSVFDYIFGGLFQTYPCHAVDFFILRYRMKKRISYSTYKLKFIG